MQSVTHSTSTTRSITHAPAHAGACARIRTHKFISVHVYGHINSSVTFDKNCHMFDKNCHCETVEIIRNCIFCGTKNCHSKFAHVRNFNNLAFGTRIALKRIKTIKKGK